jgi:hypothetical protein
MPLRSLEHPAVPSAAPRLAVLLAIALAVGCAGPALPPPLQVPELQASLDHYQGTPLTGPLLGELENEAYPAEISTAPAEQSLALRFDIRAAAGLEDPGLEPLAAVSRLLTRPLSDKPLQATLTLASSGRAGTLSDAAVSRESVPLRSLSGSLDPGMTSMLTLADARSPLDTLEVLVHRRPDGESVVVHLVNRRLDEFGGQELLWEQVMVDLQPAPDGPPLTFTRALPNGTGEVVVTVSVATPAAGDEDHGNVVELARSQARTHRVQLAALLAAIESGSPDRAGLLTVFEGLESDENRRGALLYLASITGASLTGDVALLGDPTLIDQLCDDAGSRLPENAIPTVSEAAWLLEQASLTVLVERVYTEDQPAMEAVLLRYAGEVGRNGPLLMGLMLESSDGPDLARRIRNENVLFLEDNAPASRVRAFDWLLLRGEAPPDYRPFDDRAIRRAALEAWRESEKSKLPEESDG